MLVRQVWAHRYLRRCRAPLLDMGEDQAEAKQHVDVGRQCPVLLDHALIRQESEAAMSFDFAQDEGNGIKDRGKAPLIVSEVEG